MRRGFGLKWIVDYGRARDMYAVVDALTDAGLDVSALSLREFGIVHEGYSDHRMIWVIDEEGRNEWLPAIRVSDPIPTMTLDDLRRARMAWICPEGVS